MPYHLVQNSSWLPRLAEKLKGQDMAVDTETTGLFPAQGDRAIGISISLGPTKDDDHFYIPIRHINYKNVDLEEVKKYLGPVLAGPGKKYFHNAKFDMKFLRIDGMPVGGDIHDTIIMAHLLEHDNRFGKLGLKTLGETVLGEAPEDQKMLHMHILEKFPKAKNFMEKLAWADPNVVCQYACTDTRLTFALAKYYLPMLVDALKENYDTEMRVCRGLVDTELRGVPMDKEWLQTEATKAERRLDEMLADIRKEAGPTFNPHSGQMVYSHLFEILKLPVPSEARTAKDKVSLGKDTLIAVDHPIAKKIEDYRQLHSLWKTYLVGLQGWITDKDEEGHLSHGCIHPNLNQVGTPHARFSCKEPNLQNQPKDMRPAFLTRPGYKSWRWDYSQVEMRVFAHYSGDKMLIDGYNNDPEFDIHGAIAKELGVERPPAKTVNFLIVYGGGVNKLARNIGWPVPKTRKFFNSYYARLPGVKSLRRRGEKTIKDRIVWSEGPGIRTVVKWGYVTDVFGRHYYLPPDQAWRSVNRLVAGCAANLMKHGMARVYDIIEEIRKEYGPDAATLLMNIHDEIEVEIRNDVPAESIWVPRITHAMVDFPNMFKVPIRCDCKVTESRWSDAKTFTMPSAA